MKIRKAIAATIIAATALVGTTTAADARGPAEIEFVEVDGVFSDGFESGDTAAASSGRATYLKYELVNVQVTSIDINASGN